MQRLRNHFIKQILSIILMSVFLLPILLTTGCSNASSYDEKAVLKISNLITAGSISEASDELAKLNDNSLKNGSDQIHTAIVNYSNDCLKQNEWIRSDDTINTDLINNFKNIKTILSKLNIDSSETNVIAFTDSVLSLEAYAKWNTFISLKIPSKVKSIYDDLVSGGELIRKALAQSSSAYKYSYRDMAADWFDSAISDSNELISSIGSKKDEGLPLTLLFLDSIKATCYNLYNFSISPPASLEATQEAYNKAISNWSNDMDKASEIIKKFPLKIF